MERSRENHHILRSGVALCARCFYLFAHFFHSTFKDGAAVHQEIRSLNHRGWNFVRATSSSSFNLFLYVYMRINSCVYINIYRCICGSLYIYV